MGSSASSLGGAAMGMQGIGSLMTAWGQHEAGDANGDILRFNADYKRTLSAQTMESGEFHAGLADLKETQLAGAQASSAASQGVISGAGSAGSVVADSLAMSESDKTMARLNARRQAYGYNVAAESDSLGGDNAIRQGNMAAAGTVVSSASSIGMMAAML